MIRKITFLFFTVFCMFTSRATFTPVTVTGFNKDVIANGVGLASTSTTSTVDDVRDIVGNAFPAQDYRQTAGGPAPLYYLPQNGTFNSAATAGLTYQLANYSGNNSLKLSALNDVGTLTFSTPVNATDIYIAATSGAAASTAAVLITFTDNTTLAATISVADWFNGTPVAVQGIGRVSVTDGGIDNANTTVNPRLYESKIPLTSANYVRQVQSVRFTKTNGTGFLQVMAISVNTIVPCGAPANQPTNLVLTPTIYGVSGSFTASVPPADKYMVLRSAGTATADTPPTDGIVYTVGTVLGNATIISVSAATTFTDPGLTVGSTYTYTLVGYNDGQCYGGLAPTYNLVNPTFGSATIPACSATPAGTYTVGPTGTYPTLYAAMTALGNAAGASGNIIVELQPTYTSAGETFPIVIPNISTSPCAIGNPTLTIRPAAGATGLVITGSNATAILDFNNAQRVTLDGRPNGAGTTIQLQVINTNSAGVAIRLYNDASRNTITYVDAQGQNTSALSTALSGVIYIGAASTTGNNGNDYNTISFSNVHGTAGGTPALGIVASGTATTKARYNDSCTITNCNVYDFFSATVASTGIKVEIGNNAWSINGNSLYQTATRTYTTANTHRGLWITPNVTAVDSTASNFLITNNFIGGSAPSAGGTAYTMAGDIGNTFMGMDLSVGSSVFATSVQNNVIANISLTSTSTSTGGVFTGIGIANGNQNIGTQVGNIIGSATATGNIVVTSGSGGTSFGIRIGSGVTLNVSNNIIGGLNLAGSASTVSTNFIGIGTGGGTTNNVTDNIIGSLTTPNSISIAASSSTTAQSLTGISLANGTTTKAVNNTIANLTNNYTSTGTGQTRGIVVTTGLATVTDNTIRNLTNSTTQTGAGASAAVLGIGMSSTTTGATVMRNKIYTLKSTAATAAVNVVGMYVGASTTGINMFSTNFIHSLSASTTSSGAFISGIDIGAGAVNLVNNMIRLGLDETGASITTPLAVRGITRGGTGTASRFYHNSVYVGGTGVAVSATTPSYAFQRGANPTTGVDSLVDNIFVNARSNSAAGGGKHYALYLNNTTNVSANYNLYQAPGAGGIFGYNGTADVSSYAPSWIVGDVNSVFANPQFIAPTGTAATVDLHISASSPTPIEGAGIPLATVLDDYDGQVRSGLTPTDIGADAGSFVLGDLSAPLISYTPFDSICLTTDRTFTATITDATGIPITGALVPRVYFRKGAGTWFSLPGTFVSGTANNSTWSFTINVATLGGVIAGDIVSYYVIMQDIASPLNIGATPGGGLVATDVNTVTTHPIAPNTYKISNGPTTITITPVNAGYCPATGTPVLLKPTGGVVNGLLNVGTGVSVNTTTTYPGPFSVYYGGNRHQFLMRASELTALGLVANSAITYINFPVVSIGTSFVNCLNFKVKIIGTTNTTLTAFVAGATTVFGPATIVPTVGYNNVLTFSTPYIWNGTDNLVIETTFSNNISGNTPFSIIQYNTTTAFTSTIVYRADGATAAAVETSTTVSNSYSARPDFKLGTTLKLPFIWTPTTGLYTNAAGTVAYTGTGADSVYAAPAANTTYTVTATNVVGCASSQVVTVTNDCTVPVRLLSFKGERKGSNNDLTWITTTELNNKGFELQRSADGVNFSALGFVASKAENGTSNSNITYTFSDTKALAGNNYYRLKQIDKDSKAEYSNIVFLKGDKLNALLISVIYPNPVQDKLNVIIASPKADKLTLIVSDVTGKIVSKQSVSAVAGDNKYEVNVHMLNSGNYIIKAICNEGCETVVSKFTKQ